MDYNDFEKQNEDSPESAYIDWYNENIVKKYPAKGRMPIERTDQLLHLLYLYGKMRTDSLNDTILNQEMRIMALSAPSFCESFGNIFFVAKMIYCSRIESIGRVFEWEITFAHNDDKHKQLGKFYLPDINTEAMVKSYCSKMFDQNS